MIDQLAGENVGSIKVGKVNIDENPGTAEKFGVEAIPTLMIFKGGEVVNRFVGAQPKTRMQAALDAAKGVSDRARGGGCGWRLPSGSSRARRERRGAPPGQVLDTPTQPIREVAIDRGN